MKKFLLTRLSTGLHGTRGKIESAGFISHTLELPWVSNENGISCIPPGIYSCQYTMSPRYKRRMYCVTNVEGRSGIRIHSANFAGAVSKGFRSDLLGCIALGTGYAVNAGQQIIISSRNEIRRFEQFTGGEDFILTIVGSFDPVEV